MCSEEAQILVNWGLEGVNYDVVNGKRVLKASEQKRAETDPDYSKKTGVGKWIYPFPQMGKGAVDSKGDNISRSNKELIKQNYLDVEKETLAAYGVEMWIDLFPSTESLGVSKHGQAWQYALSPKINAIVTEADDYMKNTLATLVLGKPADFDKTWDKVQADLKKIGIEEANAALTGMVKDKIKMWSGK